MNKRNRLWTLDYRRFLSRIWRSQKYLYL